MFLHCSAQLKCLHVPLLRAKERPSANYSSHIWPWNKILLHDSSTNLNTVLGLTSVGIHDFCAPVLCVCSCVRLTPAGKRSQTALLMKKHIVASTWHWKYTHIMWVTEPERHKRTVNNQQLRGEIQKQWHQHRWSKWHTDRKWRARFVYLQRGPRVGRHPAIIFPWYDPTGQWWPCHGPHTWEQKQVSIKITDKQ